MFYIFFLVFLSCRICQTHIVNEDSKILVNYSSERAQINQSFCIKQQQSCFCHAWWEPEGGILIIYDKKLYLWLLKCIYYLFVSGTNWLCLRVNACISYIVMCLSWLVFVPETVYIWITLFFKPKMDLISKIIVFGFVEIQSNNVPVHDKPYQGIFLIKFISNDNRTEWSPIWSLIIRVINKIGPPRSGSPICLITSMITDRIGRHEVLLPINHNFNKICDI